MIVYNQSKLINEWVSIGLFGVRDAYDEKCVSVGVERNGKLIAGVVYSDYQPDISIEMSIFSIDKRWCSRHNLKILFGIPFTQYKLRRVQIICSAKNEGAIMFVKKIGFKQEGYHPEAYADGSDAISFGMLKKECRWI